MAAAHSIGFDLGGTKTAAARIEHGIVLERLEAPTDGAADPAAQLDRTAELLERLGHHPRAPLSHLPIARGARCRSTRARYSTTPDATLVLDSRPRDS